MIVLATCSESVVVEELPFEFVLEDEAIPRIRPSKMAIRKSLRFWVILNIGLFGGVGSERRILRKAR